MCLGLHLYHQMYSNLMREEQLKIRTTEGRLRSGVLEFGPALRRTQMTWMSIRRYHLCTGLVLKIPLQGSILMHIRFLYWILIQVKTYPRPNPNVHPGHHPHFHVHPGHHPHFHVHPSHPPHCTIISVQVWFIKMARIHRRDENKIALEKELRDS